GSTVLDNTLIYACNELSAPNHGDGHMKDMPIVTLGGGAGRWRTGEYIDFGGRLMNNFLVSIFNVMGLSPDQYERNGQEGFGDYHGDTAFNYADQFATAAMKRAPLPYVFLG